MVVHGLLTVRRTHNELQGLLSPHCDIAGDLLISPDGKCTDCVSGFSVDWLLSCQLLEHLQGFVRDMKVSETVPSMLILLGNKAVCLCSADLLNLS